MGETGKGAPQMAIVETRFSFYHLFQLPLGLPPRNDSKEPLPVSMAPTPSTVIQAFVSQPAPVPQVEVPPTQAFVPTLPPTFNAAPNCAEMVALVFLPTIV